MVPRKNAAIEAKSTGEGDDRRVVEGGGEKVYDPT